METIVLGYDDTDASKRALERAAALASKFGAELIVTSVAPVLVPGGTRAAGAIDPSDTPADHVEELAHARAYLAKENITAEFVPAVGEPADTVVSVAEDRHADLIVVGTRELNILRRLLGQSVSEAVSHKAHCDVMIVH